MEIQKIKGKKLILLVGLAAFGLFIFFSYLVHRNLFTHFDFDMTVRLQDHLPRRVDGPFSVLSYIGNAEIVSIILLIILAIRRKLNGLIVLLSFGLFHVIELYGKTFVSHKPPPHFMLRTEQIGNFPQFYVSTQNSYPSGHSARALFLTTVIAFFIWKQKKLATTQKFIVIALLSLYDIIMVTSRVYLGEHWASDVIGGSIMGFAFATLSAVFL